MAFIYETQHFIVESFETPHVDREDGGHIRISIKEERTDVVTDRTKLSPHQAIEYMRLTMVVGEAFEKIMKEQFHIPIMKINYQDMGTRYAKKPGGKPFFHVHIYGRSATAKYQPWPEAVYLPDRSTGFYDTFRPLCEEHVVAITKEIVSLYQEEKYQDKNWILC